MSPAIIDDVRADLKAQAGLCVSETGAIADAVAKAETLVQVAKAP